MNQTVQALVAEARTRIREIDASALAALQARGVPAILAEPLSLAGGFLAWVGEVEAGGKATGA